MSVDQHTGAWSCHRCGATGQLEDYRTRERNPHVARARRMHTRMWGRPAPTRAPIGLALAAVAAEASGTASGEALEPAVIYARCAPLAATPGAAYLASRGIDRRLADGAGVRYSPGGRSARPAVIFPITDAAGAVVALQARYLAVEGDQLKCMSRGSIAAGVFATPGALTSPMVAVCEAPIDALSLAGQGIPAVALCGAGSRPAWLRGALAFRRVSIATDADEAGERAAAELAEWFCYGARPQRLCPPAPCKDWNEAIAGYELLNRQIQALWLDDIAAALALAEGAYAAACAGLQPLFALLAELDGAQAAEEA